MRHHAFVATEPGFGTQSAMAAKNTSIALGAPFTEFASRKIASGEFGRNDDTRSV